VISDKRGRGGHIFTGQVVNGRWVPRELAAVNYAIEQHEGKQVDITIELHRDRRSDRQNRFYWGVIIKALSDSTGYRPEELHMALKIRLLSRVDHRGLEIVKSTSRLTTDEAAEYIERCIELAANMGCEIKEKYEIRK
jgi:hypothetical protein